MSYSEFQLVLPSGAAGIPEAEGGEDIQDTVGRVQVCQQQPLCIEHDNLESDHLGRHNMKAELWTLNL